MAQLRDDLAAIDKLCNLTPEQRNRLTLSGRGDIQRLFDRAESLKSRLEKTGDLRTEDQFDAWLAPLGAEAEKLGRLNDAGLVDADSLFSKTLHSSLSREQLDQIAASPMGIRVPEFPRSGWIGGPARDVDGKPYLIYFWATNAPAGKANLPALKRLVDEGATIVGIHPVPVPADDIAGYLRDEQFACPTLTGSDRVVGRFMRIKTCPVKQLPYGIVVDGAGLVAGFGRLGPALLARFEELRNETSITSEKN
jgi:hypothetical protein